MLSKIPEMPQHLILAIDRHLQLIDDARRQRIIALAMPSQREHLSWRRRLRVGIGEWLIRLGQRLATEASASAARSAARKKRAWG